MLAISDTAASCLNCTHSLLSASFCPQCGQRHPHRLPVGYVAHELLHVFTHADNTIVGYVPRLLFHIGRLVADYLTGCRKRYFSTFEFLFLVVGLATAGGALLHYYEATGVEVQRRFTGRISADQLARLVSYFNYLDRYYNGGGGSWPCQCIRFSHGSCTTTEDSIRLNRLSCT